MEDDQPFTGQIIDPLFETIDDLLHIEEVLGQLLDNPVYTALLNTGCKCQEIMLGYSDSEVKEILEYIDENDTIEGAPHLKDAHLPIFDCAFRAVNGSRSIHYMGHLKMMGAAQPFVSGAISKTVNVPSDVTVDEIMEKVHEIVAGLPVDEAVVPNMPTIRHTIYFLFHGVHHEYPSDARRLVMPPVASIPMAFVVWLVFLLVFGTAAKPAFAGMMVGYLIYDSTHFLVHHYSMPTKFGKFIKRHHMRHHFKDPDKDYGVSSPLWDVIFRTFSGDRKRPTSKPEVGTAA